MVRIGFSFELPLSLPPSLPPSLSPSLPQRRGVSGVVQQLSLVSLWFGLLLLSSYHLTGSWDFIHAVHGVM